MDGGYVMTKKKSEDIKINSKLLFDTFIENYNSDMEEFQKKTESLWVVPEKRLNLIIS